MRIRLQPPVNGAMLAVIQENLKISSFGGRFTADGDP
jgi:hypothetical protein